MYRLQEIIIATKENSREIGKMERQGMVRKIAPRLYSSNIEEAPEITVRRNWYRLISELFPDAFLSHRSALERKKLTKQRDADAYIRMMLRAWEFSSYVHNEDLNEMENFLTSCDAFLTPKHGVLKINPGA